MEASLKSVVGPQDITIIIAARNEAEVLSRCLSSVVREASGQAEIICVDDGSTDQSPEIMKHYSPDIRVLQTSGEGPARARNLALAQSTRPWIAFVDADAEVHEGWLAAFIQALNTLSGDLAGVGGAQVAHSQATPRERRCVRFLEALGFVSSYLQQGEKMREVDHNPSCNVIYPRHILESVHGFDPALWPCEDLDLDLRIREKGGRLYFVPTARVGHRRPQSLFKLGHMFQRYGFGHARLIRKHGICQRLHYLMLALAMGIVMLFALALISLSLAVGLMFGGLLATFVMFRFRRCTWRESVMFAWMLPYVIVKWFQGWGQGMVASDGIAKHG